ncbi:SRPBCC family protein, partial [Acinetobacter baumannii]
LTYELYFPDFGSTSTGEFRLTPRDGGTKVSWSMDGDMGRNPLNRWMGLFMDRMVGPDFDAGLANLKALAEKS